MGAAHCPFRENDGISREKCAFQKMGGRATSPENANFHGKSTVAMGFDPANDPDFG